MMSNAVKYVILDVVKTGLLEGRSVEEILGMYPRLSEEDKLELTKLIDKSYNARQSGLTTLPIS